MSAKYVIWDSTDGPSLHGPFETDEAAIQWVFNEVESYGLLDPDEFDSPQAWYDQSPDVWIREVLEP